jgi:dihydrofolate reductase
MRKIVVITMVSLDGVMQAPGGKGEDPSGGFKFEGWAMPYGDETFGQVMDKEMSQSFDLLLGRKTFDIFAGYWPKQTDNIAAAFNKATKYVVTHGDVDMSWDKTVPVTGDVVAELRQLKDGDGPMLQVHGSSQLIQTLFEHDLVDELRLRTFQITLGRGKRLWGDGVQPAGWKLTASVTTPSGVILANYGRDGDVKTAEG